MHFVSDSPKLKLTRFLASAKCEGGGIVPKREEGLKFAMLSLLVDVLDGSDEFPVF